MSVTEPFTGFERFDSNFIICPNQYFDLCVTKFAVNPVRFVGYMILQQLRWRDSKGQPTVKQIRVRSSQLVKEGGVSSTQLSLARDEAVNANFVHCNTKPTAKLKGTPSRIGEYVLARSDQFTNELESFTGFYSGKGQFTATPIQFFTEILPHETLAVIRVIAAIIRFTIGFEADHGGRVLEEHLSYSQLKAYTGIKSDSTLCTAIKRGSDQGYIVVEAGSFNDKAKSLYRLNWLAVEASKQNSPKIEARENTTRTVPKSKSEQSQNRSDIAPKIEAQNQSQNRSLYKKQKQNISKQQPVAEHSELHLALVNIGFESAVANSLINNHPATIIQTQLKWIGGRRVDRNALGLLRKAIEENWSAPSTALKTASVPKRIQPAATSFNEATANRHERSEQRQQRLAEWGSQSPDFWRRCHECAINKATSVSTRARLQRHRDLSNPPNETLAMMTQLLTDTATVS